MLTGEVHDLGYFGFSDFESIDTAHTHSLLMDMEHDACGDLAALVEILFEHVDHELHRRVVVVQK